MLTNNTATSTVEVVYIPEPPLAIFNKKHIFMHDITVAEVLKAVGLFDIYPETATLDVGIFSKKVKFDTIIKTGDRIEVYRPLKIDPKTRRRLLSC